MLPHKSLNITNWNNDSHILGYEYHAQTNHAECGATWWSIMSIT